MSLLRKLNDNLKPAPEVTRAKEEMKMENQAFVELVAYCQRQGVLASDSSVIGELAEITGLHCYEIAELLEG